VRDSPHDELNQQIVRMLQNDGRLPYKDIAKALQVSEGTIRNRVQRMKEAGLLKIVALVDPMAIKYQADAMLGISVAPSHTPREVAERLSKCNEVVYVLWVSGRFDLMVEVVCESTNSFQTFLEGHCYRSPDIGQLEIMTGIDMFKNQFLLKRQAL
jgi:Lrp/AsnC family transcriptional regulator for asnA, asnC and gidA|tara:strand:+ start:751 stop:1218 length:468 start_codon:yes stop_codon:yes gene_type:complete